MGIERTEAARARRRPTPAHRGRVEPRPACCRGGSGRPLALNARVRAKARSIESCGPLLAASHTPRHSPARARPSRPATLRARPRPRARRRAAGRRPTPRPAATVIARAKGPPQRPRSNGRWRRSRERTIASRRRSAVTWDLARGAVRSSGRRVAVTARFGRGLGRLHAGIDIGVPTGTPVHAADSGRVVMSGVVGGHGKNVCIQHTGTLSTCYAHNSRLRVREGESVDSGDVISESGCTGRCYGDHLHSEVRDRGRAVNPRGVPRTARRWSPCIGRLP